MKEYFQETGRAGRDGELTLALLFCDNRDIAKNKVGMQDDMLDFCSSPDVCLKRLFLKSLDYELDSVHKLLPFSFCVCENLCKCSRCLHFLMEKL